MNLKKRDFTLKTHQVSPIVFGENSVGEIKLYDYCAVIVFEKLTFQNVFCSHGNEKPVFSNFLGLNMKSVFEKPRFPDGVIWTAGLTVEIDLGFQIPRNDGP